MKKIFFAALASIALLLTTSLFAQEPTPEQLKTRIKTGRNDFKQGHKQAVEIKKELLQIKQDLKDGKITKDQAKSETLLKEMREMLLYRCPVLAHPSYLTDRLK